MSSPLKRFVVIGIVGVAGAGSVILVVTDPASSFRPVGWQSASARRGPAAVLPGWRLVDAGALPGAPGSVLLDVAAAGPGDAWAVGSTGVNASKPLLKRWDGNSWRVEATPRLPAGVIAASLQYVKASSPTDVWAFGGRDYASGPGDTFALHWNGGSWQSSDLGAGTSVTAAAAIGHGSAWAAGTISTAKGRQPWAQRYDGRSWTQTRPPGYVWALNARTADDVWAVGATGTDRTQRPLAMRWNGRKWLTVPTPPRLRTGQAYDFTAVLAAGPDDVWATVAPKPSGTLDVAPLLLHWDGTLWRRVEKTTTGKTGKSGKTGKPAGKQPAMTTGTTTGMVAGESVTGLVSDGKDGLWIVTYRPDAGSSLLHYVHGRLNRQPAPARPGGVGYISGLGLIPGTGSLWAVGSLDRTNGTQPAVYKYGP